MSLALIDYGSGNIRSVARALAAAGVDDLIITNNAADVAKADRIVLPGVGAYADCYSALSGLDGMIETLNQKVMGEKTSFLGICVGMQLLADAGHEFSSSKGLGWISGHTDKLVPLDPHAKVPHIGWNRVTPKPHHVLDAAWGGKAQDVYFVHSYGFRAKNPEHALASAQHGQDVFAAIVGKDNILGTQFHPEKSQAAGIAFLRAWISLGGPA